MTDGFFAVGRDTFIKACAKGMNPAAAFLIIACGTGKDNITSRWSAEAVRNYAGVRWQSASEAIKELIAERLVEVKLAKTAKSKPTYKMQCEGDRIWLPRSIVEGAAGEQSPIARIRQTSDVMVLRMFIELYGQQNLREDGGIRRDLLEWKFERKLLGQCGAYVVWGFHSPGAWVAWNQTTKPHWLELSAADKAAGKSPGRTFFNRFQLLQKLGLVQCVPYLFDGPKGEPIHSITLSGESVEIELAEACDEAARSLLTEGQVQHIDCDFITPVLAHIEQAQLFGIARLRYRPHTKLTSTWWAEHSALCRDFTETYRQIVTKQSSVTGRGFGLGKTSRY